MIRHFRRLPFIFLLLIFIPDVSFPEERTVLLTEAIQLKVADSLAGEGEYYRAVTEYKKFLILFPESDRTDYVLSQMGMAYYKGEEYAPAAASFSQLRGKYPGSELSPKGCYYEGLSYWKLKRYEEAKPAFQGLADAYPESPYARLGLVAGSLLALERENVDASIKGLERLAEQYPDDPAAKKAAEARELLTEYKKLPKKSMALAGVMSAVVPGTGYMYAEHYGDGVTAFIINALFIAGTVTAVVNENYAVAGIVGGVGMPFYIGNIYGSANAARKWNIGVQREFRDKVFVTLDFKF